MKKGIFAHRKINPENSPLYEQHRSQVVTNTKNDKLCVEKIQNNDGDSVEYFLEMNDDEEQLKAKMDCVLDKLTVFVDNELKIAEDTSPLIQTELLENFQSFGDNVSMVS